MECGSFYGFLTSFSWRDPSVLSRRWYCSASIDEDSPEHEAATLAGSAGSLVLFTKIVMDQLYIFPPSLADH